MDRVSIIDSLAQAEFRGKPAYYEAEHFLAAPGAQIPNPRLAYNVATSGLTMTVLGEKRFPVVVGRRREQSVAILIIDIIANMI